MIAYFFLFFFFFFAKNWITSVKQGYEQIKIDHIEINQLATGSDATLAIMTTFACKIIAMRMTMLF
jgi:hypothetical protein